MPNITHYFFGRKSWSWPPAIRHKDINMSPFYLFLTPKISPCCILLKEIWEAPYGYTRFTFFFSYPCFLMLLAPRLYLLFHLLYRCQYAIQNRALLCSNSRTHFHFPMTIQFHFIVIYIMEFNHMPRQIPG